MPLARDSTRRGCCNRHDPKESVGAAQARAELGDLYLAQGHKYFKAGEDYLARENFGQALQEYVNAFEMHTRFDSGPSEFNTRLRQKLAIALILNGKLQENAAALHRVQTACEATSGLSQASLQQLESLEEKLKKTLGEQPAI